MGKFFDWFRQTALGRSIFRHGRPDNPKDQSLIMTSHFLTHIHPVKVKKHGLKFTYTFGLGGLTLGCFIILAVTGLLLMLYYVPSADRAYEDMLDLRNVASFGWFFRNLHRWAAHAMVILVVLHMARVFFTASYKGERKFNWVIGMFLLLITVFLSFTGYLLPWDQLAYWAVNVGVNLASYVPVIGDDIQYLLLGAKRIGQETLTRFYLFHVVLLPALMVFFIGFHFFRIRKDGGISDPVEALGEDQVAAGVETAVATTPPAKEYGFMGLIPGRTPQVREDEVETEMVWPHLVMRELVAFTALLAVLMLISLFFDAPLEGIANPSVTPNPAKAAWYFLWLQELLHYGSPLLFGIVLPGALVLGLMALPYLDKNPSRRFQDRRLAIAVFAAGLVAVAILIVIGMYFRGPGWHWVWPWQAGGH
ncbi:MAG: DUF4405 domain-containing protein [Clostridia bacterium]|nr:MAG: DUF4405 domain-containing protein [Clostridia bacterium]